jgi:phosphoribosylamine---glycine ligase
MNVLLLGGGGREHALAWGLRKSPMLDAFYCAPGNAGIAAIATCVSLDHSDPDAIIAFCRTNDIPFVVVGPEAPLVDGIADTLREAGLKVFGPSAAAAQLEGSKRFTKDLCREFAIPTAAYAVFEDAVNARQYAKTQTLPLVIKADGLAAGKGVTIAETVDQAFAAIDECFDGRFGTAGSEVVIEEFMTGEEASYFVLVDGTTAVPLATAQDHKRVGDGDTGPNTGGMGAYSPAPVMTPEMCDRVMHDIIEPTIAGMARRGHPYSGVLYAGLMITSAGPRLIEYNVRFGDPECQVLIPRMKSDLLAALLATAEGTLADQSIDWYDDVALTVVIAADGYPGTPKSGTVIRGLEQAAADPDVEIFHAGTRCNDAGEITAAGGRVLNVTARGRTVKEAQARAHAAIDKIDWPEGFCRHDIGWRAIAREEGRSRSTL